MKGTHEQKRLDAQKRNDLPDGVVFAKVKGVAEMHPINNVEITLVNEVK